MKTYVFIELDVPYCSRVYGTAPCTASVGVTGTRKCHNTKATCQDRVNANFVNTTLRFTLEGSQQTIAEAIPCITDWSYNPGTVSLGQDLGERPSVNVRFSDLRHSDTGPGGDKYLADRAFNPYDRGTYWGRFRKRHKFLRGQPLRLIQGTEGQALGDMVTRHFIVDSFSGPDSTGSFSIVAKDPLKLADNDRSKVPAASNGRLVGPITNVDTVLQLTPTGIGEEYLYPSGHVAIAGKEVATYWRQYGQDEFVKLLLHLNGSNGGTVFTDSSAAPHTVTRNGNAQTSTAQLKFGTASLLLDGVDDYLILDGSSDFAFGTGDFSVEFWVRPTSVGVQRVLYDSRPAGTNGLYPMVYLKTDNKVYYHTNSADRITGTTALAANTWYHVAIDRRSGSTRLFVNGVQEGSTYTDANSYLNGASRPVIGTNGNTTTADEFVGHVDELVVSKGVSRYAATFNVPTREYGSSSADYLNLTRGQLGTTALAHSANDRVQWVLRYVSADAADILYDILVNYAGVDPAYIALPAWQTETGTFLNRLYTANIAEPVGARDLASELIEQAGLAVWWDDRQQLIRLQVLRSIATDADLYDEGNTLEDTLQIQEQPEKRVSQVWVYFDQRNPCEPMREDNFRSHAVIVDPTREADYGSPAIKKILSRWIPNGGRSVALRLGEIQLARFKDPPRAFAFDLFYGSTISLGGGYRVGSWALQDEEGAPENAKIQVIRVAPRDDRLSISAEEVLFDIPPEDLDARTIVLDISQNNVNIRSIHDTLYPEIDVIGSITLHVLVETGVVIGSNSTALPALDIGSFPLGLPITVELKGRISGAGGPGGRGGLARGPGSYYQGYPGENGGPALYTRQAITLVLNTGAGEVWGGGGGGGGASAYGPNVPGAGGGGAGAIVGPGGPPGYGGPGSPGTATAGGAGGAGSPVGGAGGGPGLAGAAGPAPFSPAAGGTAGSAIDGVSYVTFTGAGDRRGPEVN